FAAAPACKAIVAASPEAQVLVFRGALTVAERRGDRGSDRSESAEAILALMIRRNVALTPADAERFLRFASDDSSMRVRPAAVVGLLERWLSDNSPTARFARHAERLHKNLDPAYDHAARVRLEALLKRMTANNGRAPRASSE